MGAPRPRRFSDEVSKLTTEFEANIPKGQRTITATPAELDGLPQDFLDAHKPGPDGKITLKTDYTDYNPVMTYAKSSDLRQRFYREYQQRAYPENEPCCATSSTSATSSPSWSGVPTTRRSTSKTGC